MRIIPTRIHGIIDYVVGVLLIAAPWALDFADGGAEQWTPVILGGVTIAYSLITDYELGVVPLIPMPLHLLLDLGAGVILAVSPWVFGFSESIWWPHLIVGLFSIVASLSTRQTPARHTPGGFRPS